MNKKDTGLAYICWFFSLHYLYLSKPVLWIAYIFTFGGLGIWALIDLFRMPSMVQKHNLEVASK